MSGGVDLIRFAAATMVVLFHFSYRSSDPDIGFAAGWIGVEIFFVISGFVIMGSASGADIKTFARSRFARLYPAAIACAVINLCALIPFADLANRYGFFVSATPGAFIASLILIKGPFLVGALWTLPVEIVFYGMIGVLIWRGWIGHPVRIAAALILWSSLYIVPYCLSQYGLIPIDVHHMGFGLFNLTLLRHGCFFGVGILLWVVARRDTGAATYAVLSAGIALCLMEITGQIPRANYAHVIDRTFLNVSALGTFSTAVLAIWLFSRVNDVMQPGARAISAMRTLGLMTYPLYLLHEGVGGVVSSLLQADGYRQGVALLAGLAASMTASGVVVFAAEPWLRPKVMALARRIVALLRSAAPAGRSA